MKSTERSFASRSGLMNWFASGALDPLVCRFGYKRNARPYSEFIAFKETLRAAKAAGLSVGEFIERKHANGPRSPLEQTMEGLASFGLFNAQIERVCEIGPGSGRYLEQILHRAHPRFYEVYETSQEWKGWLAEQHGITPRKCDGRTLVETETGSVDLVHAHKVFPGLPLLNTVSYLLEMARVVRNGGWVVFDILTETCFDKQHLDAWFQANPWEWEWSPHLVARDYAIRVFEEAGVHFVGSIHIPLFPGITECMVFRKAMPVVTASVRS